MSVLYSFLSTFLFARLSLSDVISLTLVINGFQKTPETFFWKLIVYFVPSSFALFKLTDWLDSSVVQIFRSTFKKRESSSCGWIHFPKVVLIVRRSSTSEWIRPEFFFLCLLSLGCCLFPKSNNSISNALQR